MGRLILIDVVLALAGFSLWYFCLARYNRRRGAKALRWVQAACASRGKITAWEWQGPNHLQARLAFAAHWFENARVIVCLRPRPLPLHWIRSLWLKQKETLTFEADLDCAPDFQLQVFRHRWLTHKYAESRSRRKWEVHSPGPVILTTRTEWTDDLDPVVNALMTSRGHNLLNVRFRPDSPHLAATLPLEALTDERTASSFLKVLRALAAGASTRQ